MGSAAGASVGVGIAQVEGHGHVTRTGFPRRVATPRDPVATAGAASTAATAYDAANATSLVAGAGTPADRSPDDANPRLGGASGAALWRPALDPVGTDWVEDAASFSAEASRDVDSASESRY